jgi:hypothetical protein
MILCDPVISNFGTAKNGVVVPIQIQVSNASSEKIDLIARAGCQCSTPILPKKTIEPNETITMLVNFDTLAKVGKQEKEVYLDYVVKGNHLRTTCKIIGVVEP